MSTITYYKCDRCGKKFESSTNLTRISVRVEYSTRIVSPNSIDVCQSCGEKLGLTYRKIEDDKIVSSPTEKLKEIIYDRIEEIFREMED